MTTLTIEEIAEQRLAYIKKLQALVDELVAQRNQLQDTINKAISLLKAPSNDEEPKEEEQ